MKIGKYAFTECFKLTNVEFESDSKLKIIESAAFVFSRLKEISIPRNLKIIAHDAFSGVSLKKFEIPYDSQLESTGAKNFFNSEIVRLYFPSTISKFKCFSTLKELIDLRIAYNNPYYKNYKADE